ncbi:MAG: ATP-binding protein [Candidatus Riflebacteria bacterium]|nr:ATP-binding protein [Candidatus Riflebacteria bacterium]
MNKNIKYIARSLEPVLKKAVREFPAVLLTGPRQSGKTTLLKKLFQRKGTIVSLDLPDIRDFAQQDPRGFLASTSRPLILDEIQYCPELLPYIREEIDSNRSQHGRFILSGSQNILLSNTISESLAGRVGVFHLFSLTQREIFGQPKKLFPWEKHPLKQSHFKMNEFWNGQIIGTFPELHSGKSRNISNWHSSYIQTYLERDVRTLRNIGDLKAFQVFLRLIASRCAQLLNLSEIARDVGISTNTAKAWLSLLEESFQIFLLSPYFENMGKRLIKSPKVFFPDSGTLSWLLGLKDSDHASFGPSSGAIFENAVVSEIYKSYFHRGEQSRMYFWRTSNGAEVDLIVEREGRLIPIGIKSSSTPNSKMLGGLKLFRETFQKKVDSVWLASSYIGEMTSVCDVQLINVNSI